MTPKVLSRVPTSKKAVLCLMKKNICADKLHSGMSYSALAVTSLLMNQQYVLNKVSLNKHIQQSYLLIC